MEIGISTASLFGRYYNEQALPILDKIDGRVVEVFLESFCEYTKQYGDLLKSVKGSLKVHSIHTLNTHFEPQLFAENPRAKDDALKIFENTLVVGNTLGAKNYTMHGKAKFKKNMSFTNYSQIGKDFCVLCDLASKYDMNVCIENVEWAYYGKVGFFKNVSEYCKNLKTCLDIKQARESGYDYCDYLNEMGNTIQTVHLSDVDNLNRTAIPSKKGNFDFETLFKRLKDVGFNGNCLIEIYKENFNSLDELKNSLDYLREIKDKIY